MPDGFPTGGGLPNGAGMMPANSAAFVSAAPLMSGLGLVAGALVYTPKVGSFLVVNFDGLAVFNAGTQTGTVQLYYAQTSLVPIPANAGAVVGTALGTAWTITNGLANQGAPFGFCARVPVVIGQQFWFDIALSITGGVQNGFISSGNFTAIETQ